MAYTPPLARRLRLGIVGDGAGTLSENQFGAASAFRALECGDISRNMPAFGAGMESGTVLGHVLDQHEHLLVFDAQVCHTTGATPDLLAESTLWLVNQGVDLVVFCESCCESSVALNAALERCQRVGVTLLAGVSNAWPASHAAVIGVAAQTTQENGLHWVGGEACTLMHGGTSSPADAVGEVASVVMSGIASGLVRDELVEHLQTHCTLPTARRAG